MELFTRSKDVNWNRIVNLFYNENDDLDVLIKDENTCKIIFITSGTGIASINDKVFVISSPMIITLNCDDKLIITEKKNLKADVIYFKPEVINDALTHEKIISGFFNNMNGSTVYQDLVLLKRFYEINGEDRIQVVKVISSNMITVTSLVNKLKDELRIQRDGWWPCRSRSYFLELLLIINSFNYEISKNISEELPLINDNSFKQIICYLNEHKSDKITVDFLSKKFLTNRNKINEQFKKYTGLTCMKYLLKIRMNFASLLLLDTDLPISEVGVRSGFNDVNYFIKTFKNYFNDTPSTFRARRRCT